MIEKKVSIIILDFNMINPEASTNMAKILNYLQVKKKRCMDYTIHLFFKIYNDITIQ